MRAALLALLILACIVSDTTAAAAANRTLDDQAAAWAEVDARVLLRAAPRLADGALAPTFEAMSRRVGTYADWVYGWFSSLLVAWDLAATAAGEAQREIWAGRVPEAGIVYDRLTAEVQQHFDATVVHPARTEAAIATAWSRSMTRLASLDVALADRRRERIERTAALLNADPGPTLQRFGPPLLPASFAETASPDILPHALTTVEDGAGGTADRVLVRSLRPLGTRALSVTTRLLLAPVIGGVIAAPVAGGNGLVTAAATLVTISAGIWGVDYAANRLDSALTRASFEQDLRRLIRDAHGQASRITRQQAEAAVCAALAVPSACGAAAPVAGVVRGG
ncbi:MAG: hypothetical protein RLO51_07515 [Thalassobaculum sp.]